MRTSTNWSRVHPMTHFFLAAQAKLPAGTEGPVGVAKSSTILQYANRVKRDMMLLIGSTHAPEDFSGIPYVNEARSFFNQVPPQWAERLSRPGALLFVDELTTVPPSVRAAMLSMLTERRLGNMAIHPDTVVMAAWNPPKMAPNASPLEKSMANRFFHSEWEMDWSGFEAGMQSQHDEWGQTDIPVADDDWRSNVVKWGYLITSYLRKNSADRMRIPDNDEERAFPTPRTWHYTRNCLAVGESVGAPANIMSDLATGCIGKTVGSNFMRFVAQLDLIDPEECLSGNKQFVFDRKRVDLAAALLVSLVSCIKQHYTEDRLVSAVDIFCNNIGKHTKDLVFTQLKNLVNARPEGTALPKKALEIISAFGKTIPDAVRKGSK
jgi:hypothetical protein